MDNYIDRKIDYILKYLNCNTVDEALMKIDNLMMEQKHGKQVTLYDFKPPE